MKNHPTLSRTFRHVASVVICCAPLLAQDAEAAFGGATAGGSLSGGDQSSIGSSGGSTSFSGRSAPAPVTFVVNPPPAPVSANARAAVSGSVPVQTITTGPGTVNVGTSSGQVVSGAISFSGQTMNASMSADNGSEVSRSRFQTFTKPVANTYQGGMRVITGRSMSAASGRASVPTVFVPVYVPAYIYVPAPTTEVTDSSGFTIITTTPALDSFASFPIYSVYPAFGFNQVSRVRTPAVVTPALVPFQNPSWIFPPWNPAENRVADYTNRTTAQEPGAVAPAPVADHIHIIHIVH